MGRFGVLDRATLLGCLDALEEAQEALLACPVDTLNGTDTVAVLTRLERISRRAPTLEHRLLTRLVDDGHTGVLGTASLSVGLSERLHISVSEARRRVNTAADLAPRTTLTGQSLPAALPHLAAAQADGTISAENIEIVRKTCAAIPAAVTPEARDRAEADLTMMATQFGPASLHKLAEHLLAVLDPDGDFDDRQRNAKRGLTLSRQHRDGLSRLTGKITPELRATLEPLLAKLAAPGMCNPADEHPCLTGTPSEAQISADNRNLAQRQHDALLAVMRAILASGDLGQHNGLPVTAIITTTLAELTAATGCSPQLPPPEEPTKPNTGTAAEPATAAELNETDSPAEPSKPDTAADSLAQPTEAFPPSGTSAQPGSAPPPPPSPPPAPGPPGPLAGKALTAGGTVISMRDFLRMASHAYHYLLIYDDHGRPLWLGRTKRLASADQRIVLHARDHGCTRPGCTASGYHCQAHHLDRDWAADGQTNINSLGLACPPDNVMATQQDWHTQLNEQGRVQWIPPAHLDEGQPRVNPYHFIEDLLDYHRQHPKPPPESAPLIDDRQPEPWWNDDPQPGDPEYENAYDARE